jgi:nucleotide-binding universal stress UspA family protein
MAGEIVVGYDGSDGSDAALNQALTLAEGLGCGVVLAFCFEPPAVLAGGAAGSQRDAIEAMGETRLNHGQDVAAARGMTVHAELVDARPVEGLIAAADEHDAIMIVVGHHGEGPLRGALLGATANKLLHQAERPVLVVPALDH